MSRPPTPRGPDGNYLDPSLMRCPFYYGPDDNILIELEADEQPPFLSGWKKLLLDTPHLRGVVPSHRWLDIIQKKVGEAGGRTGRKSSQKNASLTKLGPGMGCSPTCQRAVPSSTQSTHLLKKLNRPHSPASLFRQQLLE